LLDDGRSIADPSTADHINDPEFDEVTAPKLAIDCHIEQRTVPKSLMLIDIEPNDPDISGLQQRYQACTVRARLNYISGGASGTELNELTVAQPLAIGRPCGDDRHASHERTKNSGGPCGLTANGFGLSGWSTIHHTSATDINRLGRNEPAWPG